MAKKLAPKKEKEVVEEVLVEKAVVKKLGEDAYSLPKSSIAEQAMMVLSAELPSWRGSKQNGLDPNLIAWSRAKQGMYEILSCHPDWNPATLSIESTLVKRRPFNRANINERLKFFLMALNAPFVTKETKEDFRSQLFRLKFLNTPNISPGTLELYDKRVEAATLHPWLMEQKPVVGQKTTRYIRSVMVKAGHNPDEPATNKHFLALCDSFADDSEGYKFVLSINPSDYLTMSCGNSWESCHRLRNGCWRRGTLSYMNDEVTMISYVLPQDWENRANVMHKENRTTIMSQALKYYRRAIMWDIDSRHVLQSRLYPSGENNTFTEDYSNLVLRLIEEAYRASGVDFAGFNSLGRVESSSYFGRGDNGHYADYGSYSNTWQENGKRAPITKKRIGGINYCLSCGRKFDTNDSTSRVMCCACKPDNDWGDEDDDDGDDDDDDDDN